MQLLQGVEKRRCKAKLLPMKVPSPAAALLPVMLLAGCAHGPPHYGETRRESDAAVCANAANTMDVSVKLRPDGTCDITHWSP